MLSSRLRLGVTILVSLRENYDKRLLISGARLHFDVQR